MPNPHYSAYREQTSVGPKDTTKATDTTGASKKGQRGGWATSTNKATHDNPGKESPGWVCSTRKAYGTGGKVNSTKKSESGSGWISSSKKRGV